MGNLLESILGWVNSRRYKGYRLAVILHNERPGRFTRPSERGTGIEFITYDGETYLFSHDEQGASYLAGKIKGKIQTIGGKLAIYFRDVADFMPHELANLPEHFRKYVKPDMTGPAQNRTGALAM